MSFAKTNLACGMVLCVTILVLYQVAQVEPSNIDHCSNPQVELCQATYYTQYTGALAQYPKAHLTVNKYFYNGTCLTQCQIKSGKKVIQTLDPIVSPNFTPCGNGGVKLNKQCLVCFDGVCSTLAQIAQILGTTTTPTPAAMLLRDDKEIQLLEARSNDDNGKSISITK